MGRRQQGRWRRPAGQRRVAIFRPLLPVVPAMRIAQFVGQRPDDAKAQLSGPAKELSIKIGQNADNVERSFYNSFGPAWDNIDMVVRGTLAIMEASAD